MFNILLCVASIDAVLGLSPDDDDFDCLNMTADEVRGEEFTPVD